jgi:hypothetical protein
MKCDKTDFIQISNCKFTKSKSLKKMTLFDLKGAANTIVKKQHCDGCMYCAAI